MSGVFKPCPKCGNEYYTTRPIEDKTCDGCKALMTTEQKAVDLEPSKADDNEALLAALILAFRHEADASTLARHIVSALSQAGLTITSKNKWRDISEASKEVDSLGLTTRVILGFAPDEEDHTLPSVEGFWSPNPYQHCKQDKARPPCWVSCVDPDNPYLPAQPTHFQPLPEPPEGT